MILRLVRLCLFALGFVVMLGAAVHAQPLHQGNQGTIPAGPIPLTAPELLNADMECTTGYYTQTNSAGKEIFTPNDWQVDIVTGAPVIHSARVFYAKSCDGSAHVERISGIDSIVIRSEDMETPPEPGKPFDVAFYQQVTTTAGAAYSLSGWMLSLCGGSAVPTDCPDGYYISKMLGIDPTGGTDPNGDTVVWTENRHNFIENGKKVGWQQMTVSAVAEAITMTVFARVQSPFRWHGNHAFVDALSLVRAPIAELSVPAIVTGTVAALQWDGVQSPDIEAIPGGSYRLLFDIQYRHGSTAPWNDFLIDYEVAGSESLDVGCSDTTYEFRIRVRSEQPPPPEPGAWPNHRYAGVWSLPISTQFVVASAAPSEPVELSGPYLIFLPHIFTTPATCK
ncbi:MAG: hypothetical protein R3C14_45995 [Caldilineaceae bacterium]